MAKRVMRKKKKSDSFKMKDLKKTLSTINPFQYKEITNYIFKGDKTQKTKDQAVINKKIGKNYK